MNVPSLPAKLNLSVSPAAATDAAELAELFNAIADADATPERLSETSMQHELESYFDPLEERTLVVRDGGSSIVAYATVYSRRAESDEMRAYVNVHVAPGWRDRGIEDPLTDWAIAAAEQALADAPVENRFVCAWLYKKQEEASAQFASRGFTPIRHWWEMERLLNLPIRKQSEDGFEVVPWLDEHDEPARLVHNAAFADHWGSTPIDEEDWKKQLLDNPALVKSRSFVALGENEVVGYATVEEYPEDWDAAGRKEAWIGTLGVLREWRNRGIATALLTRSMEAMKTAGLDAAMIGVDSDSPSGAQHLYASVGFVTRITGTTWQLEVD